MSLSVGPASSRCVCYEESYVRITDCKAVSVVNVAESPPSMDSEGHRLESALFWLLLQKIIDQRWPCLSRIRVVKRSGKIWNDWTYRLWCRWLALVWWRDIRKQCLAGWFGWTWEWWRRTCKALNSNSRSVSPRVKAHKERHTLVSATVADRRKRSLTRISTCAPWLSGACQVSGLSSHQNVVERFWSGCWSLTHYLLVIPGCLPGD